MSTELAAVEELLIRILPDPMGFAERVLGELMERLATPAPSGHPTVLSTFGVTDPGPWAGAESRSPQPPREAGQPSDPEPSHSSEQPRSSGQPRGREQRLPRTGTEGRADAEGAPEEDDSEETQRSHPAGRTIPPGPVLEPAIGRGIEALADRVLLIGAALGACECWGENACCPECSGQGGPGWVPPDPELYRQYVLPAVHRAGHLEPDHLEPDHREPEQLEREGDPR